ncbi:glycoside hydrolase family 25 domain-containing protein [Nocardioides terrisoli]|uniref:hypothetical protein n=1 Tax=Nocardioides terrisoli TaxID=3388267 RepID=UPI00287B5D6F|nr:hypothetical protein [Nocardioides marmorisolisilvae]
MPARIVLGIRRAIGLRPAMGMLGTDVSWPQCGRHQGFATRPLRPTRFVVVGLTNGPAFHPNSCLAAQVRWIRSHHVHAAAYAVTSYPSRHELRRYGDAGPHSSRWLVGRLRNVGYRQAKFNLATMKRVGLHSDLVWVDVEPSMSRPWTHRRGLNAAVVQGLVRGYRSSGHRIGFYSTASLWRRIIGRKHFHAPEWRTAGPTTPRGAIGRCSDPSAAIQGGRAVLAQWWTTRRDHDLLCPGSRRPAQLARFFHQY